MSCKDGSLSNQSSSVVTILTIYYDCHSMFVTRLLLTMSQNERTGKLFSSETAKMFETIKIVFDSNRGSIQPTMHSTGQFVRTIREGKILNL